jgi:hypothetical protein
MISSERGFQRDRRRQLHRAILAQQTAEEMLAKGVGKTFNLSWESPAGPQVWTDIDPDAFNQGVNKIIQALQSNLTISTLEKQPTLLKSTPWSRVMKDIKSMGSLLQRRLK